MAIVTVNHKEHEIPAKILQRIIKDWIDCGSVLDAQEAGKLDDFIDAELSNPPEYVHVEGGLYGRRLYGHIICKSNWKPERWSHAVCGTMGYNWHPVTKQTTDLCPYCKAWIGKIETS